MNVFLTGASGFLGKKVLQLLVDDPRITTLHIVSRKKLTHPSSKVHIHKMDLSLPWTAGDFLEDVDAIIHLAGLYQFSKSFTENYTQNVLPVANLIDRVHAIKRAEKPQVLFASTYAIGLGSSMPLKEEPLPALPPESEVYSYTKALAERALLDSQLATRTFRLGVLVGDRKTGEIEKLDGPYYLMNFLNKLNKTRIGQYVKKIPLPISDAGIIPLVPVDCAARVFHESLFQPKLQPGQNEFFGVFNPSSVRVESLFQSIFRNLIPHCRPAFLNRSAPTALLELQAKFTQIPKEAFYYVQSPIGLENPHFQDVFGAESIPLFETYQRAFFEGFKKCFAGENSAQITGPETPLKILKLCKAVVEAQVGSQAEATVETQGEARVEAQAGARAEATVETQVGTQAGAQVGTQAGAQVGAQAGAQVGAQAEATVETLVGARVEAQAVEGMVHASI